MITSLNNISILGYDPMLITVFSVVQVVHRAMLYVILLSHGQNKKKSYC